MLNLLEIYSNEKGTGDSLVNSNLIQRVLSNQATVMQLINEELEKYRDFGNLGKSEELISLLIQIMSIISNIMVDNNDVRSNIMESNFYQTIGFLL